jgi:hypothetical protein
MQRLLNRLKGWPRCRLRALGAIETLERVATPEACPILGKLAEDTPDDQLRRAAKEAREPLTAR